MPLVTFFGSEMYTKSQLSDLGEQMLSNFAKSNLH